MYGLPYSRIVLNSPFSPSELITRLQSQTEPRRLLRWSREHNVFEGEINGNHFCIRRIMDYRNSFRPEIYGQIEPITGGSQITLTFHLHMATLFFILGWFLFCVIITLSTLFFPTNDENSRWVTAAPLGMILFGYAITMGGFYYEKEQGLDSFSRIAIPDKLHQIPKYTYDWNSNQWK